MGPLPQGGNFMIFLSLRIYVKSILWILKVKNLPLWFSSFWPISEGRKLPFWTILEVLLFNLLGISHLKMSKFPQYSKFRAAKIVKMSVLEIPNDKIWFHVKTEWQENPEISSLCHNKKISWNHLFSNVLSKYMLYLTSRGCS